jgi:hypothetical protein
MILNYIPRYIAHLFNARAEILDMARDGFTAISFAATDLCQRLGYMGMKENKACHITKNTSGKHIQLIFIVSINKKGDKTDGNNYRGISLLSTSYNILSNILLSRLSPYRDEIIVDHQCLSRRDRPTTDHVFCNR